MKQKALKLRYQHPLIDAYQRHILQRYHKYVSIVGDPLKIDMLAVTVQQMGLGYSEFVELACTLWADYAAKQGLAYPVWVMITSPASLKRLAELTQVQSEISSLITQEMPSAAVFEAELMYAVQYIQWRQGIAEKPLKCWDTPAAIRAQVAQQVCRQYGVPFVSSNYNSIYSQICHG